MCCLLRSAATMLVATPMTMATSSSAGLVAISSARCATPYTSLSSVPIDAAMPRAQAAKARAERDLARQQLARVLRLREQNAAPAADVEKAEAAARAAEASLAVLELQIERSTVRAPFAGMVGQRFVSVGDGKARVHFQSGMVEGPWKIKAALTYVATRDGRRNRSAAAMATGMAVPTRTAGTT